MSPEARRRVLLAGYAVVTFLSFPHPVAGGVLDLGLVCGWVGPALLVLALGGLAPRRALGLGFAGGLAAHTLILHWIYVVTVVYGHAPVAAGVVAPVALAAYLAAFPALFGWGWARLGRWGVASPFAAAALWTACDHLRSFALTGFPWATLGYAQHRNAALLPLAAFSGVYGLSFVTALGGAALARWAADWPARRRPAPAVGAALAVVAAAHGLGLALRDREPEGLPRVRVAVIQGNIDQGVKWSARWAGETLRIYEDLSRRAVAQGAQLVVWPETAAPGSPDGDPALRSRLAALARETGAAYVVGAVGLDWSDGPRPTDYYDSAFLFDASGNPVARYDKSHLVPFGEYVPFQDLVGGVLRAVARGMAPVGVTAGAGPRALELPVPAQPAARLTVGVPICYELIFPDLVRRFARDGAGLLLGITNDAWYGRTGAPYQFLAMSAVRSAETRLWMARAANTGVSAIIDASGRVQARTRIFERDLLVWDVPVRSQPGGATFYARHGDVFASSCWIALAVLALTGRLRQRGAHERNED